MKHVPCIFGKVIIPSNGTSTLLKCAAKNASHCCIIATYGFSFLNTPHGSHANFPTKKQQKSRSYWRLDHVPHHPTSQSFWRLQKMVSCHSPSHGKERNLFKMVSTSMIQIYSEIQPWFISFPSCINKNGRSNLLPQNQQLLLPLGKGSVATFQNAHIQHLLLQSHIRIGITNVTNSHQESPKSSTLVLTEGVFEKPLFYVHTQLVMINIYIYTYTLCCLQKRDEMLQKKQKKTCEITSWFASLLGGYFNSIEICQIGSLSLSLGLKIMRHNVCIVEYSIYIYYTTYMSTFGHHLVASMSFSQHPEPMSAPLHTHGIFAKTRGPATGWFHGIAWQLT